MGRPVSPWPAPADRCAIAIGDHSRAPRGRHLEKKNGLPKVRADFLSPARDRVGGDVRVRRVPRAVLGRGTGPAHLEHALGGVHAPLWEGEELIGHGSVVMRRLLHDGMALRTGYVEAVAVRADRRRRGHGEVVMEALERVSRSRRSDACRRDPRSDTRSDDRPRTSTRSAGNPI